MSASVLHGDCRDLMAAMDAASVDALVSDPPYGLSFMGKGWDKGVPGVEFWTAALRVMKPGAYLVAFGGTRTYHRMASAIEDAGFEIHDCLSWLYGSGFPKHKSKLKPAWEPIVLARKPAPRATLLNVDACRIGDDVLTNHGGGRNDVSRIYGGGAGIPAIAAGSNPRVGRWPANVVLDEEAAAALDAQSGERPSGGGNKNTANRDNGTTIGNGLGAGIGAGVGGDTGGASRFFYCAKASRTEREAGLGTLPLMPPEGMSGTLDGTLLTGSGNIRQNRARNNHPTVKPVALMRWLVRLVTPPGGLVLDPFSGSGTTGVACVHEARAFVGCEQSEEYAAIARARIAHAVASTQPELVGAA